MAAGAIVDVRGDAVAAAAVMGRKHPSALTAFMLAILGFQLRKQKRISKDLEKKQKRTWGKETGMFNIRSHCIGIFIRCESRLTAANDGPRSRPSVILP
jgi:hypothetical protein